MFLCFSDFSGYKTDNKNCFQQLCIKDTREQNNFFSVLENTSAAMAVVHHTHGKDVRNATIANSIPPLILLVVPCLFSLK